MKNSTLFIALLLIVSSGTCGANNACHAASTSHDAQPAHELYTLQDVAPSGSIAWYRNKESRSAKNFANIMLVIGMEQNKPPFLQMQVGYASETYMFIQSFSVIVDDIDYGSFSPEFMQESSIQAWEWCEIKVGADEYKMIEAVIKSRESIIRYFGRKFYKDYVVSEKEKELLNNMLLSYMSLGGKPLQ